MKLNFVKTLLAVLTFCGATGLSTTLTHAQIIAVNLGKGLPVDTLGGYTMAAFNPTVTGGNTYVVGQTWETWGQGYTGDVYGNKTSGKTLTVNLGSGVHAVEFYAEPELFESFTITAKEGNKTLTETVNGDGGASGFGFYSADGGSLSEIKITAENGADGFAIGEFSKNVTANTSTPEPSTYAMMLGALALLGFCLRRKSVLS
jgi:hypothetical protein